MKSSISNGSQVSREPGAIQSTDMRSNIIESLRRGEPLRTIGRNTGFSRSTIDRVCNEEFGLYASWKLANQDRKRQQERKKLAQALSQQPAITLKELRQLHGSGYRWLVRHDKIWLKRNLPECKALITRSSVIRKGRVDWSARDQECLDALEALEHPPRLERWERLQPRALLRRLPKISFVPRLERLPKSKAKIKSILCAESARRQESDHHK